MEVKIDKIRKFKKMYENVMMHRPVAMIKQWIEGEALKHKQQKSGFEGNFQIYKKKLNTIDLVNH